MPDNWINQRKLTSEDAIYDLDGNKINDLINTEVFGGTVIDSVSYPKLADKLLISEGDNIIPTITRPTGSPHPYKIVADATSE